MEGGESSSMSYVTPPIAKSPTPPNPPSATPSSPSSIASSREENEVPIPVQASVRVYTLEDYDRIQEDLERFHRENREEAAYERRMLSTIYVERDLFTDRLLPRDD